MMVEADLRRNAGARHARQNHETGTDAAEDEKSGQHVGRQTGYHETVPRMRISMPLPISRCERTGVSGCSLSTIMRT